MIQEIGMIGDRGAGAVARTPPAPARPGRRELMLLHSGAMRASLAQVRAVRTPSPTASWYPIPHGELIAEVREQLASGGFEIGAEGHALAREGARYFGVLEVSPAADSGLSGPGEGGYGWVLGLRNSHDKSYPAGLVAGTRVFVCDNLAFSGEVRISRRHTRHAVADLRLLTARAVGRLGAIFAGADARVRLYRSCRLCDVEVHDIIIRAADCGAITPTQIPGVLDLWRRPWHEEFEPRTAWSLYNAFTEYLKNLSPAAALARGEALHGLLDGRIGLVTRAVGGPAP